MTETEGRATLHERAVFHGEGIHLSQPVEGWQSYVLPDIALRDKGFWSTPGVHIPHEVIDETSPPPRKAGPN